MSAELVVNAAWAVMLWSLSATGVVLVLRGARSAVRRDICRLALLGVPVILLGVAAAHAWRPPAGLIPWRVSAAAPSGEPVGSACEPAAAPPGRAPADGTAVARARPGPAAVPELLAEPVAEPMAAALPVLPAAPVSPGPARPAGAAEARAGPAAWVHPAAWAWGAIAAILLGALVRRVGVLALWRRHWHPASGAWMSLTRRLAGRMGLERRFAVYVVPGLAQPAAAGVFRPAILLPDRPDARVTPALRGALLHELGHVAGADPIWSLIGLGAAALAWWCPAVWLLRRRAQVEGEMTADDCAMESGARPTDLARALLAFAERIHEPVPAAVPGMGCYLKRRVEMMIDTNRPHNSRVAGRVRWLFVCMALALASTLALTPLVGVAAPADVAGAAEPAVDAPAAAEPAEPSIDVALVRNRAQEAAARKERDEVRRKLYTVRYKIEKSEALTALREAASEASEAYEKTKATDPEYAAAKKAEQDADDVLDALVLAKIKASPDGAALIQKMNDLEQERASLSMVYAIAEVKLTHRDSPVNRALDKDKALAKLYKEYQGSLYGPIRDKNRSAYKAARKAALAGIPQAAALMEEMASAKKGMQAAQKARDEAQRELRKMQSEIERNREDPDPELQAARKAEEDTDDALDKAYNNQALQAVRDARDKTRSAYSAKLKELMAADPEASALQTRYNEIDKEIDRLEDEARELKKKRKAAARKPDAPEV